MKEFNYKIKDALGIHARPAGLLVKEASKFSSEITIKKGEKSADLKRIFSLMSLGVKQGDEIVVKIKGEDELLTKEVLEKFIKENL